MGIGSPTEIALVVLGTKVGLTKQTLAHKYQIICEFPFDSTIKRMSSLYEDLGMFRLLMRVGSFFGLTMFAESGGKTLLIKGAPERLLDLCPNYLADDTQAPTPMNDKMISKFRGTVDSFYIIIQWLMLINTAVINQEMADEGLRVLGLAYREFQGEAPTERNDIEQQCIFVGFVGIRDPPRDGVKEAIEVIALLKWFT